jgi:2-polyprenyl-3-methyl-5-hydroxy-6-metoxy-1,4-benzoquinol methylase
MSSKAHWEALFKKRQSNEVSWHQPQLRLSLKLFESAGASTKSKVIDIGGGDSTLVDDLLTQGVQDVTVLDISSEALSRAKKRLGARAGSVKWIESDIGHVRLPSSYYDVWHDRAVFHFIVDPEQRAAYSKLLGSALRDTGHVIMATFAADGPTQCSGLLTMRYSPAELQKELGSHFDLLKTETENHRTPTGAEQRFVYCLFQRRTDDHSS